MQTANTRPLLADGSFVHDCNLVSTCFQTTLDLSVYVLCVCMCCVKCLSLIIVEEAIVVNTIFLLLGCLLWVSIVKALQCDHQVEHKANREAR